MKYVYAQVSAFDQNPALQLSALKRAGCETIFKDEFSGASAKGPALQRWLKQGARLWLGAFFLFTLLVVLKLHKTLTRRRRQVNARPAPRIRVGRFPLGGDLPA